MESLRKWYRNRLPARAAGFPATLLPALFALLFGLVWFCPSRARLVGWGEDPAFNVWTLEQVWRHLGQYGVLHLFSAPMWQDPIFHPLPYTHALSENMFYLGLLSWPLRALTGNSVLTMNVFALLMNFAAFLVTGLWLRKLGVRRLCWWGGLIFAAGGWVQGQSAHYQNISVFLFPLSFWLWLRFREAPAFTRLVLCAFAFSWIAGWNLYFQVFSNVIFSGLLLRAWIQGRGKPSLRKKLLILGGLSAALELPILIPYFRLQSLIGSLGIGLDDYRDNSARLLSFLSQAAHSSLLAKLLPFYPDFHFGIEATGFLGLTWVVLAVLAARRRDLRLWIGLALAAYIVSLGPDFVLMDIMRAFPGFGSLRAVGRVQLLVLLASLPPVLALLESFPAWKRGVCLGLVILELFPAGGPPRISVPPDLDQLPSAFSARIRSLPDRAPLLVFPVVGARFQLYATQFDNPLYDGYSGRWPASAYVLRNLLGSNQPLTGRIRTALEMTGARWVVMPQGEDAESLKREDFLSFLGCYPHFEFTDCLFQAKPLAEIPRLRLDRDASWEYPPQRKGHLGILRATRSGVFDFNALGSCKLVVYLKAPFLPEIAIDNTMTGMDFKGVYFKQGEIITEQRSPQAIFSLPHPWRPDKRYRIVCQGPGG